MLTKLEAGKTYVFKDEEAKRAYLLNDSDNLRVFDNYYDDGFLIDAYNENRGGCTEGTILISIFELKYFKEKDPVHNTRKTEESFDDLLAGYKQLEDEIQQKREEQAKIKLLMLKEKDRLLQCFDKVFN